MTTLTARPAPVGTRSAPEHGAFAGTPRLVRFALRRDRIRLAAWLLGVTALSMATAVSFAGLYVTAEDRQGTAATMDSPAGLAMTGPRHYLIDYNLGSMMGHQML